MSGPTFIDAFCGAGGLSLGLQWAGFSPIGGFDLDPVAIETCTDNTSHIKHPVRCLDVKDALRGRMLRELSCGVSVDLLAGGPPCQGFSAQRTVGPDEDPRNLLVDHYFALVRELRPRFFLMENVPGIGGPRGREVLRRLESNVARLGYQWHQATLDAADFGVPQRRRRVFIVGELSPEGNSVFTWPEARNGPRRTVREAIGHLPPPGIDPSLTMHRADRLSPVNLARIMAITEGQGRVNLPSQLLARCHRRSAEVIGHRKVYGRMSWDDVAPTITARFDSFTRGQFGHPEQNRSISLLEGALLQTFPADYLFAGAKVDIARQIGNAVPPLMAEVIGRAILRAF
jgi:DNA (cytosine-5)-methyltransferase 1